MLSGTKDQAPVVLRKNLSWMILAALLITGSASAAAPLRGLGWEQVAPGIDYIKYELPDPNNVFVVRMDRSNPSVTLESTIATGELSQGLETVSSMYNRYDQALNYWGGSSDPPTWGMRNQAVVAINGSYFDWDTGSPQGGMVQSGWYSKRYDDLGGWSGFAWKLDRSAFIGECVNHRPEKQLITYPATATTQQITKVNSTRGANELVLFTPQYNRRTGTDNSGVEVLVEMARPTMILPYPAFASGIVRSISNDVGNSWIRFNNIVLSASGTAAQTLSANVQIGTEIRISQEITSYEYDCSTPNPLSWTKTYASIQGAFFFLENGQIREFDDPGATEPNPRTAIAYNDQYIYFLVVDGRDVHHSIGMTIHQLAQFSRDTLGATYGVAQDGGGSSTMVINGVAVNNTFCNIYSCTGDYVVYLPVIIHNDLSTQSAPAIEGNVVSSAAGIERVVANGMMMVLVQPDSYSPSFIPGDSVIAVNAVEMRLGPGTNYASFTTILKDAQGTIMDQYNDLNGVYAKSYYWWYVNFGSVTGWVPETALVAGNQN